MKTYIYTFFALIVFNLITVQVNAQDIFTGTWEHQNGNEIFRVILQYDSEYGNEIYGHYEKVEVNNGIETYIYCSDKEKFQDQNKGWLPYVITAIGNNITIGGSFTDNTVDSTLYNQQKLGHLTLEIISNSGGLNPTITMRWRITKYKDISINESPNFSVPTDIILTKQ